MSLAWRLLTSSMASSEARVFTRRSVASSKKGHGESKYADPLGPVLQGHPEPLRAFTGRRLRGFVLVRSGGAQHLNDLYGAEGQPGQGGVDAQRFQRLPGRTALAVQR
ncbi:hypothetical protein GCM10023096_39890 [Nonomuraea ferruginea]